MRTAIHENATIREPVSRRFCRASKTVLAPALALCAFSLFSSCDNPADSSASGVESASKASSVAYRISSDIGGKLVLSRTQNKTWNNEEFSGAQGTMTVTGSYDYTKITYTYSYPDDYYEFKNVSIECNGYSSDDDKYALILTGTATLNGSIHEKEGSSGSSYSGAWVLSGTFKLTGLYNDEVTINLQYKRDSMVRSYSGTLTTKSGDTYSIVSSN